MARGFTVTAASLLPKVQDVVFGRGGQIIDTPAHLHGLAFLGHPLDGALVTGSKARQPSRGAPWRIGAVVVIGKCSVYWDFCDCASDSPKKKISSEMSSASPASHSFLTLEGPVR